MCTFAPSLMDALHFWHHMALPRGGQSSIATV